MTAKQATGLRFDGFFLLGVLALVGLGIVIIYSSSANYASSKGLSDTFYLISHLKKAVIGIVALLLGLLVDYHLWKKAARIGLAVTVVMLIFLLTSSNVGDVHGAKRWIMLGGFGIQPSEVAKLGLIFFLARFLSEKSETIHSFKKGVIPAFVVPAIVFLLVLGQPDYSSAAIILSITVILIFAAGAKLRHLIGLSTLGIPAMGVLMISSPYRLKRMMAFISPEMHSAGAYQTIQSLISLGNGGITGTGLGTSTQKLGYLPMPFTDTIFSIMGEELGLVGTLGCLVLFGLVIWRGLRAAFHAPDKFGSLTALGMMTSMSVMVVMHIGVCTGFLPTTGQPLPFVSFGGTALITMLFSSGVILNISHAEPAKEKNQWQDTRRSVHRALAKQRMSV